MKALEQRYRPEEREQAAHAKPSAKQPFFIRRTGTHG